MQFNIPEVNSVDNSRKRIIGLDFQRPNLTNKLVFNSIGCIITKISVPEKSRGSKREYKLSVQVSTFYQIPLSTVRFYNFSVHIWL